MWAKLLKPRPWVAWVLLLLVLAGFVSLGVLGYWKPVRSFLDSDLLSFYVGDFRFSAYLLTKGALTVVVLFWLTGLVADFGEKRIKSMHSLRASNKVLMVKAFQIVVYFLAFIVGLYVVGVDLKALAVFSGAVGIGVGFGLQKITSNFMSGVILLSERSVEVGDLVELTDGTTGFIRKTGARYTLLETFDGREILIPNEDFITNKLINWTYSNTKGRVEVSVGVGYQSDLDLAISLMLDAAREHPRTLTDPPPVCYVRTFADSAINCTLFFWVGDVTEGRYEPQSDVMRAIWHKFKAHNITIPYPQRDVHLKQEGA